MNKTITMKTALAALACTVCISASAQKQYPEQEKMKPGMSEYWTPQPKVVTPGCNCSRSCPCHGSSKYSLHPFITEDKAK